MRVLHAPWNVCGQPRMISLGQRALGIESDVLVFNKERNYDCDINLNLNSKLNVVKVGILAVNFVRCLFRYDIFHFHHGKSLLPYNLDLPILKILKKKTVMHYWGSDVIQSDIAAKYTLLDNETIREICQYKSDVETRKKLAWLRRMVDTTIVGDYSLLPFSPESVVVRQAFDLTNYQFVGCKPKKDKIVIVHAPTRRKVKGTKYILPVIDRLKKEGYPIEFILVENKSNHEALKIFKKADIIVDDVLQGPYGMVSMECMAFGKPIIDRIDKKLVKYYPGLPLVNTNPDTLYDNLKMLIKKPALRETLGLKGRRYLEEHHVAKNIAKHILDLYMSIQR